MRLNNIESVNHCPGVTRLSTLLAGFLFCLHPDTSMAQEIFKIVDENGNVTYSTEAPRENADIEVITPLPEPSEEDIAAAEKRQADLEEELERQRETALKNARAESSSSSYDNGGTTIIVQPNPGVLMNPYYYPRRPPHWRNSHLPGRDYPGPRPTPRY